MDSNKKYADASSVLASLSVLGKKSDAYDGDVISDASCVTIGVASPETIRSWSHGEVKSPETINYRTFKPEKGGLFCERIFGPSHDYECSCGKYKRVKRPGVTVCDRCGVEVTESRVRRERMGHLELAVPVSHVWFYKCLPSRIGAILDIPPKTLDKVLYYENWIVTDAGEPGSTPLQEKQVLTQEEYDENKKLYGDSFEAGMGAEAVETLLGKLNLAELKDQLAEELAYTKSKANRKKIAKRYRIVEGFLKNNMDPRWMILRVLPVLPPDLRPLVPLEHGRFATSDLNDLYRRVINRNNRLKNLIALGGRSPEVIIRNEKRMLQEAVDALLDNGRHGRAVTGSGNRVLKSLTDMLKGKQGRFRQNLLGKRVDYSGRSVIVVGPELRINQCGLPKEMALVLFEPFILQKLKKRGYVFTVKNAKKWVEQRRKEVWDILDEVTKGHPVMLNRAPTLHRLSIQAFDPVLIEGQAIRLHPLVCTAFNADFDGDQMAVHVPLSNEAQLEAKLLMLSPNNIFSPASGKPLATPTQDICLGVYFLTYEDKRKKQAFDEIVAAREALRKDGKGKGKLSKAERQAKEEIASRPLFVFNDYAEVLRAMADHKIGYHDFFYIRNPFYGVDTVWSQEEKDKKFLVTTAGRCIFNEIWPKEMGFRNARTNKKQLGTLISDCYEHLPRAKVIEVLDAIKALGYEYATWAGFSIGIQDMLVPEEKKGILAKAQKEVDKIREERRQGLITDQERFNKCTDAWAKANNELKDKLLALLQNNLDRAEINPVYAMLDSGARGNEDQVRQLAGMRGLMSKPNGKIIEEPVKANFREGLTVLEYFLSSHGARKGLSDTALKTADSGYMTRRLVDVAHDVICVEDDCGTVNGIWVNAVDKNDNKVQVNDRIIGRFSVDEILDPRTGKVILDANQEITKKLAQQLMEAGIDRVHIRSVLTCESVHGICAKCYGRNLATGEMPCHGDPLGIIAAQSIGEPGTQLTMRTFHQGGTADTSSNQSYLEAKHKGRLHLEFTPVKTADGKYVVISPTAKGSIQDDDENVLENFELKQGAILEKGDGDLIEVGDRFVSWDPYNIPIVTRDTGRVHYNGLIDGVTYQRERGATSGKEELTVMEMHREDIHPSIDIITNENAKVTRKSTKKAAPKKGGKKAAASVGEEMDDQSARASYPLPANAHIVVEDGAFVRAGEVLAKMPRQVAKSNDITGGLPRVAELFEARRPKHAAEIARIDGYVSIDRGQGRGGSVIYVQDVETGKRVEHKIPAGKQIIVNDGDFIHRGGRLTSGDVVLQDMLEVCGPQEMQEHLVNQVQEVYRGQGVEINNKHVEIIVRQMMRRVRITEPGNTTFLYGEMVDKHVFDMENQRVINEGLGEPAESTPLLLGITKATLATDSFISAASFQDTTHVLTEAATVGSVDYLHGFKENVIMGHLIPAGTGYYDARNVKLEYAAPSNEDEQSPDELDGSKKDGELDSVRDFLNL